MAVHATCLQLSVTDGHSGQRVLGHVTRFDGIISLPHHLFRLALSLLGRRPVRSNVRVPELELVTFDTVLLSH